MSYPPSATQRSGPSGLPSQSGAAQVYQIDFTAVASGKRIASSKRRIRWRFGFANPSALAAGQTGTACRGEEHDITLVWSITSGKRLVLADGQEVHYSSNRSTVFDFSWTMRGNHVLKIMAHSSPPLSATPGFRQYDFYIDGQSFFTFPKVFRLGLTPNDPGWMPSEAASYAKSSERRPYGAGPPNRLSSGNLANLEAPHNPDEEEAYLKEAIKNSLQETSGPAANNKPPPISSQGQDLLLDFFSETSSQPSNPTSPASGGTPLALPPSTSWGAPPAAPAPYGAAAPPAPQQPLAALPPSTTAPYAPQPFAPPPPVATQPPPTAAAAPYRFPPAAYGGPSPSQQQPPPAANPFGAPTTPTGEYPPVSPTTPTGQYGAAAPVPAAPTPAGQYGTQPQQYPPAAPPAPVANPFASPPPPAQTVPGTDFAAPPTPSTMGFASPTAVNGLSTPGYPEQAPPAPTPVAAAPQFGAPAPDFAAPPQAPAPAAAPDFGAPPPQAAPDFSAPAPAPDFGAPAPPQTAPEIGAPVPTLAGPTDPAAFTMNALSSETPAAPPSDPNASLADQAYAKFANMTTFDLTSKSEPVKANPFAAVSAPIGGTVSLADMKKNTSGGSPKKEVMRSVAPPQQQPPQPGASNALVLSSTQNGNNWGGQFAQQQQQQSPQAQPTAYGAYGQQPAYGQQQQQQPAPFGYGQQPPYGQPPAPAPAMQQQQQQQQYPYAQPAAPTYGQQPPPFQQQQQQQPWGY